jgi:hypothetical protein
MSSGDPSGFWIEGPAFLATYESEVALTLDELSSVELKHPRVRYPRHIFVRANLLFCIRTILRNINLPISEILRRKLEGR